MQFHKLVNRLSLSLLAVAILVPFAGRVNDFTKLLLTDTKSRTLRADGTPIPPLPPPKKTFVADGTPIPPIPPPKETYAADGSPIPPVSPHKGTLAESEVLMADGTPIPPLPPPKQRREGGAALPG